MKERLYKARQMAICLVLLLTLVACASEPTPTVEIGVDHSPELEFGESVILEAVISPSQVAGPVEYKWSATAGSLSKDDAPTVEFTAPDRAGEVAITVVVTIGETNLTVSRRFQVIPPEKPTETPTEIPTEEPTTQPTKMPTATPTKLPTEVPTEEPTAVLVESPTETPTESPPMPSQPTCEGNTSEELVSQMWEAYDAGNYEKALICIQEVELRWAGTAKTQQASKMGSDCAYTPDPDDQAAVDGFWAEYWALNDVGVSVFMRGEILREQGQCAAAREAYQTVIDEYSCAYAWDPSGPFFWSVVEGARVGLGRECP
jgi:hypothetical protein